MATTTSKKRATLHNPELTDTHPGGEMSIFRGPDELDEFDEPEQTDVDRVAALLEMAGGVGRASVKVYRMDNGKAVFCESYQPSEFEDGDFSMIRENFGAGAFRVMLYGLHPATGNFGRIRIIDVTIAEKRGVVASNPAQVDNGMAQILKGIADGQAAMLAALIESKNVPQRDPLEEMGKMFAFMATAREAMGMNVPAPAKSSIAEMMEAIRDMRSVAAELAPGGSDAEPSLTSMLPQVLDVIKTGLDQRAAPQGAIPQVVTPASLQNAQSAPQETSNLQGENVFNPMLFLQLRGYFKALIEMASTGKSTDEGAAYVAEHLPDDLVEMMELPNWFDLLKAVDAAVAPHEVWVTEARNKVIAMLDDVAPVDTKPN